MTSNPLFRDRGGLVELPATDSDLLRDFLPIARTLITEAQEHAFYRCGRRPNIMLCLYSRDELGAACIKTGLNYHIGLSAGLGRHLTNLFGPLVATGRLAFLRKSGTFVSKDPTTNPLVKYLCRQALRFQLNHELGHILNGHLDYLEFATGEAMIADTVDAKFPLDNFTRQTLEMDADSGAVSRALTFMVNHLHNTSYLLKTDEAISNLAKEILFYWSFSIYVLFRHVAFEGPIFESLDQHAHAPPQLRAIQAQSILASALIARRDGNSRFPFSIEAKTLLDVLSTTSQAILVAEQSLAEVRNTTVDFVPLQQGIHEETDELLLRKYRQHWIIVRPHLERYAYTTLAPARPLP